MSDEPKLTPPDPDVWSRYLAAGHAIQSGVAYEMEHGGKDTQPKHLRTGINMAMCDITALTRLLVEKGIITSEEWYEAIVTEAEREVERYEERANRPYGGGKRIRFA